MNDDTHNVDTVKPSKSANKKRDRSPSQNETIKKEKQRPETWNKIEQQIFFNALRQNGKNFEAITQYFNTRQKRYKIDAVQRSKEQIRHFYYRTWHKINKYISIPNDQLFIRDVQVNCLIAFNLLMNKSFRWNKKSAIKLVELINHGWTTVRKKGKITRLKMPLLKHQQQQQQQQNLNNNQNSHNDLNTANLPQILTIQLQPKNDISFSKVHKLAQNPYVEITLQSTHTIKYLINYLETRWKEKQSLFIEKLLENTEETLKKTHDLVLHIDSSHSMCPLEIESIQTANSIGDDLLMEQQTSQQQTTTKVTILDDTSSSTVTNSVKIKLKSNEDELVSKSMTKKQNIQTVNDDENILINEEPAKQITKQSFNQKKSLQLLNKLQIETLKKGLDSSNDLTFIQLYLALKKPNIIKLNYEWIKIGQKLDLESIDRQKYYIDILARTAQSYLTSKEAIISKQSSSDRQVSSPSITSLSSTTSSTILTSSTCMPATTITQIEKAKKPRQRKTLIVKNSRLPTQNISQNDQNIVMCNPMQGIARQLITYSDDDSSTNSKRTLSITNTDNSAAFLDTNSNMSSLSSFLDSCKSILGVPLNQQQQSQQDVTNQNVNFNVNTTTSFKRIDTTEWNEVFGDLSLTSFMTELQSPEKNKNNIVVQLNNDNSRDSLFFNMDSLMDISLTSGTIGTNNKQ